MTMNCSQDTMRISARRRNSETKSRSNWGSMSKPALSFLMAALLFSSPELSLRSLSSDQQQDSRNRNCSRNKRTIRWAAEAMSPAADLTAAAAAAVIRRNVISGAAIFTVGDAAAQILTSSKSTTKAPAVAAIVPQVAVGEDGIEPKAIVKNSGRRANLTATLSSLDLNRLWSSTILGAIWSGFCVPFIYGNVEKKFPGKANLKQILIKVLVTCSILSTIGNYVTMFARRFIAQYTTYQFDKTSSLRLKWFSKPVQSILLFLSIFKGCFKSCNRDILEVIVDDLKIWPLYDLTCYSLIPPAWRPITTSMMSSGWAMYMSIVSAKGEEDEEEIDVITKAPTPSVDISSAVLQAPVVSEPRKEHVNIKTIQVIPLENPFPKKSIASLASSETTKRLIGVKGGTTSDMRGCDNIVNTKSPQQIQNANNNGCDDDDDDDSKNTAQSAGASI